MPPPRKVYPPVPDPGLPFDLGALDDLDAPAPPTAPRRWWQRKARPVHTPTVALHDPRALLALVPEAEQSRRIRAALLSAGAHYAVPARITLLTGLDARDVDMWDHVVRDIVQRHTPFTVRLVGPEVVQDRTVCLRVAGGGATRGCNRSSRPPSAPGTSPPTTRAPRWARCCRSPVRGRR